MRSARPLLPLLFLGTAALAGCEPGTPGVPKVTLGAEVEGAVQYDGRPVPSGIVSFTAVDGAGQGGGAIKDGKYRVYPESGLQPGKYRVEIRWGKPTGVKIPAGFTEIDEVKEAIPDKYNAKSELVVEIAAGKNTRDFTLAKVEPEPMEKVEEKDAGASQKDAKSEGKQ